MSAPAPASARPPLADDPPGIFEGFADLGPLEPHGLDTTRLSAEDLAAAVRAGMAAERFRLR